MTDNEILDRLGGTVKVAEELRVKPQIISAWRRRGISAAGRYKIQALARRKRVALPENFIPA